MSMIRLTNFLVRMLTIQNAVVKSRAPAFSSPEQPKLNHETGFL